MTQIYASPENFTPLLEVIEVTFDRSGLLAELRGAVMH